MHQARSMILLMISGVALAAGGCKKKDDNKAGSASGTATAASGTGTGTGTGTGAVDTSNTASSGDIPGLKPVSDCPKSLTGNDTGVDRTIKKECGTIAVQGDYSIDGKLTIEGGVTLAFQPGASMTVGYSSPTRLVIAGTKDAPVTFTLGAGDKLAGAWKGVHVHANASRSSIDGLVLELAGNDQGALTIDATDVTVKNTTIRDATEFGLYVNDNGTVKDVTGMTFERAGKIAASLPAASVGGLGAGNTFKDQGAFVQIRGGTVDADATWQNPGADYRVDDDISLDGKTARATLTIQAGTTFAFAKEAELGIGYSTQGKLVIAGTKDKPVVMKGVDAEKGAWKGVIAYASGELEATGLAISEGGEDGALRVDGGTATVKDSTIKGSTVGLAATNDAKLKAVDGCTFDGNDKAWVLAADLVGAVAATNTYAKGSIAETSDGTISHDQTWQPQAGVEVHVTSSLAVDKATLTLAAGVELRFDDDELGVGYSEKATLVVAGTTDKPVTLRGVRDEKGAWKGVQLYPSSNDNKLENLVIANADNDAAVTVSGKIHATINGLTCKGCNAGVTYECESKVDQTGIKMDGGGTPEKKPEGC